MTITSVEDILEHYGVKGMKWGVRKDRSSGSSSSSSSSSKKSSSEGKTTLAEMYGNRNRRRLESGKKMANRLVKVSGPYQVAKVATKMNKNRDAAINKALNMSKKGVNKALDLNKKGLKTAAKVSTPYMLSKSVPKAASAAKTVGKAAAKPAKKYVDKRIEENKKYSKK